MDAYSASPSSACSPASKSSSSNSPWPLAGVQGSWATQVYFTNEAPCSGTQWLYASCYATSPETEFSPNPVAPCPKEQAADIIEQMPPDEAADVIADLPTEKAQELAEVVADLVRGGLEEDALVAEALVVELQALQLDAQLRRLVAQDDPREVRVPGLRADGRVLLVHVLDDERRVRGGGEALEERGVRHGREA